MKRSINRWTTTLATVAMLGLPVVGFAQDPTPQPKQQPQQQEPKPQPTQPQPAQPAPQPAQPQPEQPQPQQPASPAPTAQPAQSAQSVSPQEHLSQAKAAADSIDTNSVPAKSRSQFAQLKKHLAALEKAGPATTPSAAPAPATAAKSAEKSKSDWGTEVAAVDKIITEMLGSETATGTTATPGAAGTTGKAAASIAIDDATRAKLMDIRTHITAYAAGMSGTATPKTDAPAPSPEPTAAATPAEQPSATPSAAAPSPAAAAPSPDAQSPAPTAAAAAQPQIDADGARRSLVAARESLTQLTKLPAAGQLSGDARTQVGQLIANFNELISAQTNWRASYTKVAANLTALLGSDSGDAAAAPAPAPAPAATPGAVGTAGSTKVELDPSIREKLVELRKNLAEFEKASGGAEVK